MNKRPPKEYGNESITSLKGADRVRKRPSVIFGSDGVEHFHDADGFRVGHFKRGTATANALRLRGTATFPLRLRITGAAPLSITTR